MIFLFLIVLILLLLHFHPRPLLPLLIHSFCSSNNTISNSSLTVKLLDGLIYNTKSTNTRIKKYIKGSFEPPNQTDITSLQVEFSQYSTSFNTITTHSIVRRNRRSNLSEQIFQKRKRGNVLYKTSKTYQTVSHSFIYPFCRRRIQLIIIPRREIRRRRRRNVNINYKNIIDLDFDVANWRLNINSGRHPIHKDLPLSTITFTPWTFFITILSFVSYLMTAEPSYLSKLLIVTQIVNG